MFILSDKAYNFAKALVQIYLPALGALYFSLSDIWNLPHALQVVGTITCVTTFLGVCLGISHKTYESMGGGNVGTVQIKEKLDGGKSVSLELRDDMVMEDLETKDTISFKVNKEVIKEVAPRKAARATKK